MSQLSNYPPGVTGMEPQINGYPESVESGICPNCHLKFDELDFVWYGEEGMAECPECEDEIWIDAPEKPEDPVAEEEAGIRHWQERHML